MSRPKWRVVWIAGFLVPLFLGALASFSYDDLRTRHSVVEQTVSTLDDASRARLDLAPVLVEAARDLIPENPEVFATVAETRTLYIAAKDATGRLSSAANLDLALAGLISLVTSDESTSENEQILGVLAELDATEVAVTRARDTLDAAVSAYNESLGRFPNTLFATLLGFEPRRPFAPGNP